MADMVVDEIRRRQPETRAPRAGMKRRRDVEFEALRPHRVVIILAIEPDHVLPHSEPLRLALDITGRLDRPVHQGAQHRNLVAELFDGKFQLLDRLLGRVHRDDRGWRHAVGEGPEILGRDDVVGASGGSSAPTRGTRKPPVG